MRMSTGPADPGLYDIDDEFAEIMRDIFAIALESRITGKRFLHRPGIAVTGTMRVSPDPALPQHAFFADSRRFTVLARYTNSIESDDVAPAVRGFTLRLLDPDGPRYDRGLLDVVMTTGECQFASTASVFDRFRRSEADRLELVKEFPQLPKTAWSCYRQATSFAEYSYYSQAPQLLVDVDGRQWLVRYRLIPGGHLIDESYLAPDRRLLPPIPPDELRRDPADTRAATYLRDELCERLAREPVEATLQIQLHPVIETALDSSRVWRSDRYPWRDAGKVVIDHVADAQAVERLDFNPLHSPPDLGIPLACSPHEYASLGHLRVLLYQMTAAARRREPLPHALAGLLHRDPGVFLALRIHPTARRVCVIGAGPAGLIAARELTRAGHQAVVLEAQQGVGGKCASVEIDGKPYDLGGHLLTSRYQTVGQLIAELGLPTEPATPYQIFDPRSGRLNPPSSAFFQREPFQRYQALRARSFPDIGQPGLAHSARALAAPATQWMREHGLEVMAATFGPGYTGAGYGDLSKVPALYFVKLVELTGLLDFAGSQFGHHGAFTVSGGMDRLWQRIAEQLPDVRCGEHLERIERDADGVRVHTTSGVVEADSLVLTVPLSDMEGVLDLTERERDLARRVRYLSYRTTIVTAQGLPRQGFYFLPNCALHHRYSETDVYAVYTCGDSEASEDLAGAVTAVHTLRDWRYMPHFDSADLAGGVYDRLEALQGDHRTYHVGSLPAFELIESVVAHAQTVIRRSFPVAGGTGDLRSFLADQVAIETGLARDQIDPSRPVESFGLESIALASIQAALSERLGYRVSPTMFLDHPSLEAIARELSGGAPQQRQRQTLLVPLTPVRPFFCVGGGPGGVRYLRTLADALGGSQPFYGLQAPGLDGNEPPLTEIPEIAARYLQAIRAAQPAGPYVVGGHSFGGVVAYETARQLLAAGERVAAVVLLDTYLPQPGQAEPPSDPAAAVREVLTMHRLTNAGAGIAAYSDELLHVAKALGAPDPQRYEEFLAQVVEVYAANVGAFLRYEPPSAPLRVTLIKASAGFPPVWQGDRQVSLQLDLPLHGWERLTLEDLQLVPVPGDHFSMVAEPHVSAVAEAIRSALSESYQPVLNAG